MKTIPIALAADYADGAGTFVVCLKITRTDAVVYAVTEHDQAIVIDGVTYNPGFDVSSLRSSEGLSVDSMELRFLDGESDAALDEFQKGFWDGAEFLIFKANWKNPAHGVEEMKRGIMGEGKFQQGFHSLELRSLAQLAQQTQGAVTSKTCRARLGSTQGQFKCMADLTSFTFDSTITAVTDSRHFADSARAEADGFFSDGYVSMQTGDCAGQHRKVKLYTTGGILLAQPFVGTLAIGDEYTIVAGCDRTRETCRDKFDNILNFQGEPDLPGADKLTSPSTSDAEQPDASPDVGTDTPDFPGG